MRAIGSVGGAVLSVVVFIALLGLIEIGGITYRHDCITQSGNLASHWTVTWFAPIPFVFRPSEQGCTVHTGTRVALNAVGIDTFKPTTAGQVIRQSVASTPGADEAHKYYALLYADLKDLQDWNTAHPTDTVGAVKELQHVTNELDGLTAPNVVTLEHAQLVALFRSAVARGKATNRALAAGDTATASRLAASFADANKKQAEILTTIATKLGASP